MCMYIRILILLVWREYLLIFLSYIYNSSKGGLMKKKKFMLESLVLTISNYRRNKSSLGIWKNKMNIFITNILKIILIGFIS